MAHDLANMWFDDLVTMRWWNGIWLHEAFATLMEIAACDAYAPDWERWTSFGLERSVAFETESPADFLDLVQELRGSESSAWTLRDVPIFTCVAMSTAHALDALDGAATARPVTAVG